MKKTIIAVLIALLMFGICGSVYADVIFEPDDQFYAKHQNECTTLYYGARYRVTKDTSVFVSPQDDTALKDLKEDEVFYSSVSYKDPNGVTWYYYSVSFDTDPRGWVPDVSLERLYDSELFTRDYRDRIENASEAIDLKEHPVIIFYYYPTGEEMYSSDFSFLQDADDGSAKLDLTSVFTDDNGLKWGYVDYFYGGRNAWVCIDHPELPYDELKEAGMKTLIAPKEAAEQPTSFSEEASSATESAETKETASQKLEETTSPSSEEEILPVTDRKNIVPLVAGSTGGVAVLTAALLVLLKKKKH